MSKRLKKARVIEALISALIVISFGVLLGNQPGMIARWAQGAIPRSPGSFALIIVIWGIFVWPVTVEVEREDTLERVKWLALGAGTGILAYVLSVWTSYKGSGDSLDFWFSWGAVALAILMWLYLVEGRTWSGQPYWIKRLIIAYAVGESCLIAFIYGGKMGLVFFSTALPALVITWALAVRKAFKAEREKHEPEQ